MHQDSWYQWELELELKLVADPAPKVLKVGEYGCFCCKTCCALCTVLLSCTLHNKTQNDLENLLLPIALCAPNILCRWQHSIYLSSQYILTIYFSSQQSLGKRSTTLEWINKLGNYLQYCLLWYLDCRLPKITKQLLLLSPIRRPNTIQFSLNLGLGYFWKVKNHNKVSNSS